MKPHFEKLAYDLSLIYAQERFRHRLSNGNVELDDSTVKLEQMSYLKEQFSFALDMYLMDESFLSDFIYAFK